MIYILFPGGAFGTTLEYCIRRFSKEFDTVNANIRPDGSMHNFIKTLHPVCIEQLEMLGDIDPAYTIITPVYPNNSLGYSAGEIIDIFKNKISSDSKVVFVTLDSKLMCERNTLFQHYKIVLADMIDYNDIININSIKQWNQSYTSFNDMQRWEQREMFSLIVEDSVKEFNLAKKHKLDHWLTLSSDDILFDLPETVQRVIRYLNLTYDNNGMDEFYTAWREKQQYILNLHQLAQDIVTHTVNNEYFEWGDLDIRTESLVQSEFRTYGFNLKCFNLNKFPNNSTDLYNLLTRSA